MPLWGWTSLNRDFREMLCALSDANVEFLVVGSWALATHGFPRAAGDIDLWVRPEAENIARVIRALATFRGTALGVSETDFAAPDQSLQIGLAPNRIDILREIDGVAFDEAWSTRVTLPLNGFTLFVIARDLLLRNKRATGRTQDAADAERLEGASG